MAGSCDITELYQNGDSLLISGLPQETMTQIDDDNETAATVVPSHLPEQDEEIKEFHFHVYFFQTNQENCKSAEELRDKIFKLVDQGFFHVVPLWHINVQPIGPHTIGRLTSLDYHTSSTLILPI